MKQFDLVIVGGGMVGASLALLLRPLIQQGLSVALVDAQAVDPNAPLQPSFDARTSALSLGTQRTLEQLGVWSTLSLHCNPIEHIQVSQQGQFGRVKMHADQLSVPAMGQVVENRFLGQALWQALAQETAVQVFAPAKLTAMNMLADGAELAIEAEGKSSILNTKLAVLADGANSTGCRLLGIEQRKHDYAQHAIVVNVSFDRPHDHWAYERFTQEGPLALLPLTANRFGVVWCQSPERTQALMALDEVQFANALQRAVGYDKGRIAKIGARQTYPLALVQAQEQARSNVVVLGNAAHALHPVAGQGFNLALRDTVALAKQIEVDWRLNQLGQLAGLQQYVTRQGQDQRLTTGLSHGLPTLFTQTGALWSTLRGVGLTLLDNLPTAKRLFARQAMGLVGQAPRWDN